LVATIGWFLTKMSKTYVHRFSFQIEYQLPANYTFDRLPPSVVEAEIQAQGWTLMTIFRKMGDRSLIADAKTISDNALGTKVFLREALSAITSNDWIIIDSDPVQLNFSLVERASKKVPVELFGEINLNPQYQLKNPIQYEPDSILIYGPEDQLSEIHSWNTTPISMDNISKDFTMTLPLEFSNAVIGTDTKSTEITVTVDQLTEREIYIPISIPNTLDQSISIFPDQVLVTVNLGLSKYDQLSGEGFKAIVIQRSGLHFLEVEVTEVPSFATYVTHEPKTVDFFKSNP